MWTSTHGMLFVRWTLVSVDNSRSMFNAPKTHGSRAWVALSARAVDALQRASAFFRCSSDAVGLVA